MKRRAAIALVWLGAILWLTPLLGAFAVSLRSNDDLVTRGFWSIPKEITLSNYIRAWEQAGVSRYLKNSFLITIPAIVGILFFSSMAAYGFVRFRLRFGRGLYYLFIIGMLLPFQMLMLPVFELANRLHLYDTLWGLILFHVSFELGFGVFILRNFMKTIPESLFDSAMVDGASEWVMYRKISLPLTLPALAALATLEFTWIFNDYFWALVLVRRDALKPVTTGLSTLMGRYATDWPVVVSGGILAAIPTLLVFLLLQRYFIGGLTLGATKG
ncbi:MAG: Binding-protein-dependent transport systems inner membrane component [Acetothermia bacterium 64_32]|nr:MAG: Binding-protein-dependent transport systems inner membrane component [Acetothermia bacterium 64_32]HAF70982.1 sugar ABC transporter permease [Candidatus Acetothermia bacterium]